VHVRLGDVHADEARAQDQAALARCRAAGLAVEDLCHLGVGEVADLGEHKRGPLPLRQGMKVGPNQ
jgi:hypothetical protein